MRSLCCRTAHTDPSPHIKLAKPARNCPLTSNATQPWPFDFNNFSGWCVTSCRLFSILFVWFHQEISRESVFCCVCCVCAGSTVLRCVAAICFLHCSLVYWENQPNGQKHPVFHFGWAKISIRFHVIRAPLICWLVLLLLWWWRKKKALCDKKKIVMQQNIKCMLYIYSYIYVSLAYTRIYHMRRIYMYNTNALVQSILARIYFVKYNILYESTSICVVYISYIKQKLQNSTRRKTALRARGTVVSDHSCCFGARRSSPIRV